jgi:aldehyde dehydrogenase (NAD+)
MHIEEVILKQRTFFNSNQTKNINFRIEQLKKLKTILKENEPLLFEAIYKDFGKSEFDTYSTELAIIYQEISLYIKKIKKWSRPKRVFSGLANLPAKSYIIAEPLGTTLVIGAWNYPYHLSLLPALTSIAAGNTVILKPSELPINTSNLMANLINSNFSCDVFHVIEGGVNETTTLLNQKFDKIFFTGSTKVGKIVYEAAAKQLTPVTLELGGKSPTFVFADADLKISAKRIVWAKFLNAGQTCVAPDYILVEKSIEKKLLEAIKKEIETNYNFKNDIEDHYVRIINDSNFDRLSHLINIHQDKIFLGGEMNKDNRFITPTVLQNISFEDEIMEDEIFGPILPVISFTHIDETINYVKSRPKPLSCYIYSKNNATVNRLLNELSFGGGAVNDSIMHLVNERMPFGGVGESGIGNYHGKYGFDTFTHYKSILDKGTWFEPNIKYPPYTNKKLKLIKWFLG